MKKLLYILTTVLLISCGEEKHYRCTKKTITILNKKELQMGHRVEHMFYLYDGDKAYWYHTDNKTYNHYMVNDTLPAFVIIIR